MYETFAELEDYYKREKEEREKYAVRDEPKYRYRLIINAISDLQVYYELETLGHPLVVQDDDSWRIEHLNGMIRIITANVVSFRLMMLERIND